MPNDSKQIDMSYVLRLEPELAVDYLRAKGVNVTWDWHEQLHEAHARAFTVAKATKAEVLDTIRWATEKAIEDGVSEREYIKNLEPMLKNLGWWGKTVDENGETIQLGSPRRLKTILRTNKLTAFHAARYAEQMDNIDEQPYWQYMAIKDSRTRMSHLALHGKVYRADDPIWQTMYPPNDWNCRCRVRPLSEFALQRQGLSVSSSKGQIEQVSAVLGIDRQTGEELRTMVSKIKTDQGEMKVGAGWSYNVGSAAFGTDVAIMRKLHLFDNRDLRQQVIQAINNSEARHQAFADWVNAHLGKRGASNRYISAGFVSTDIAEKVAKLSAGQKFSERVLVMSEKRLNHSYEKHQKGGVGLSLEEYQDLSRMIAEPDLVLWDNSEEHQNLIYVNKKLGVQIMVDVPNHHLLKPKEAVDAVINAYKVDMGNVKRNVEGGVYKIIQGEL